MTKKNKRKIKNVKNSLNRSAAYSDARLGDWEHCVKKAFRCNPLNEHYNTLINIAFNYGKETYGFYEWVLFNIIWRYSSGYTPQRYSSRTLIFK